MALEDVEKDKKRFKSDLGQINQGPKNRKNKEQLDTIENVKNFCSSIEEVAKMFNGYAKNISRNIYASKQGTGLKVLTPEQILQKIANSIYNSKNNSKIFLNETRQIVYSLYQSNEITKKVYNNIIKSLKV